MIGLAIRGSNETGFTIYWCGHTHRTERTASDCAVRTAKWAEKNHVVQGFEPRVVSARPGSRGR
jgi:hypothetical protein